MKEAIKVDLEGYYVEPVIVPLSQMGITEIRELLPAEVEEEPKEIITGYIIAEKVPEGLFIPRWDFSNSEWIEGMSQEEIDEIRNAPVPLSPEQRIAQLEVESVEVMLGLTEIYESLVETNSGAMPGLQRLMSVFSGGKR
ncbi:hypothetical protein [Cohnella sp.]|uniref:hypothetical protein n=1 Tax=Cohnella sp. TaxID=1883426 RepID=UPI00356435FE